MDIILIIFLIFVGSGALAVFAGGITPEQLEKQNAKIDKHIKWLIIINIILWTIYFLIP